MNLIKELKPFESQIDAFKKGYGITDTEAISKLSDIWDKFTLTRKKEIYGTDSIDIPKTKTNCSSCIKDMMTMLVNWSNIETAASQEKKKPLVEFKGVPDKAPVMDSVGNLRHTQTTSTPAWKSFQDLKKEASKIGVKFTPKTSKEELIKLIAQMKA